MTLVPSSAKSMHGSLDFDYWLNSDGTGTGRMVISNTMHNPFGTVHAGALIWFADVVATTTAMGTQDAEPGQPGFPLAINLNTQLFSNRSTGVLFAHSHFVKRGKTLITMRTVVQDEAEKILAELTSTHIMSR